DRQPSPTTSAGEEAGQKRPAATAGLWAALASVGVGGEQRLVAFELLPRNIGFVVILDHHLPVIKRLGMPVGLARPAIDDLSLLAALTVDVGAGVEWVLEHRDHVAVADRRPLHVYHPLAIGGPREMELIGAHRKMDLTSAAKFPKAGEDHP